VMTVRVALRHALDPRPRRLKRLVRLVAAGLKRS
jgi:hypothetical protein